MQEAFSNLKSVISKELSIYEVLLSLAERQRDALITRDVDALMEIASKQAKLISQADRVSIHGREALTKLGSILGLEEKGLTLLKVVEQLNEDQAPALKELRSRTLKAAGRLTQLNQVNAMLFENALEAIQFTMKLLAGMQNNPDPCYPIRDSRKQYGSVLVDQVA